LNISGAHSTITSANVRFGLEDTTCVTEPPSEKAVINAACEDLNTALLLGADLLDFHGEKIDLRC